MESLTHRLARLDDVEALRALMDAAIAELQQPFLDPAQIAASSTREENQPNSDHAELMTLALKTATVDLVDTGWSATYTENGAPIVLEVWPGATVGPPVVDPRTPSAC